MNIAKVSLFAFEPVNFNEWKKNEGTLKDSMGHEYDASMPYVVMQGNSYVRHTCIVFMPH